MTPPAKPDYVVRIRIGADYLPDLVRRLQRHNISHAELARESGFNAQQLSRMFAQNKVPLMRNIERIEDAIIAIRRQRAEERTTPKRAARLAPR